MKELLNVIIGVTETETKRKLVVQMKLTSSRLVQNIVGILFIKTHNIMMLSISKCMLNNLADRIIIIL